MEFPITIRIFINYHRMIDIMGLFSNFNIKLDNYQNRYMIFRYQWRFAGKITEVNDGILQQAMALLNR